MFTKKIFILFLLCSGISAFAQDSVSYRAHRSVWSIIPRIGIGDRPTRGNFTTVGSIGLRREFALFSLLSLNAVASYSSAYGHYGNANLNVLGVGGGLTVYPFGLIQKINSLIDPRYKSRSDLYRDFYFEIDAEFSVNNTKHSYAGDANGPRFEVSLGRYTISKSMFVAPKFGQQVIFLPEPMLGEKRPIQFNFFYLGAGFSFNPKPKTKR